MANLNSESPKVLPLFIADAFTKRPFCGNPAAVCLLPSNYPIDNDTKQKIAAEMNLSETAFPKVIKEGDTFQNGTRFVLQWFTPKCEVPLCGHATMATSAVLFSECVNESEVVEFETLSGILKVRKLPDNRIEMDFPAYEHKSVMGKCDELVKAIAKDLPVQDVVFCSSAKMYLIQFNDNVTRKQFEEIKVNGSELLAAERGDVIGVIVTVKASGKDCTDEEGKSYDFLSRFFAPWVGVVEDPVCGSSHCVLAPYWAKILNKTDFYGRFCSSRGGDIHIQLVDDRILLSGHAAVVVKGQLHI
ncbi:phenazine biosynthesis-like domain-containing protein [Trichonephila clavata]|uniref:Phenazine biosynthesis-like domain-containing protein n=1 Tax=Trichonephila clavata TaxID=2740835 RepID=A0A8X6LLG4_TRICU|nr:phenazine biosynthesis-like domain-containing protein [Trichonephila clavata]